MTRQRGARPLAQKRFWDLIALSARQTGKQQQLRALRVELSHLPLDEIVGFDMRMWLVVNAAYTRDLLGAAVVINGAVSDDGFTYFRFWLVSRGREVYEAALKGPDSLAAVVRRGTHYEFEGLMIVAQDAWKMRKQPEEAFFELAQGVDLGFGELKGPAWDLNDEEQLRRRYPRLARRFLTGAEE
jgi:hypothetical protein